LITEAEYCYVLLSTAILLMMLILIYTHDVRCTVELQSEESSNRQ